METDVRVNNGTIFVDGDAMFSGTTTLGNNADVEINDDGDSLRLLGKRTSSIPARRQRPVDLRRTT